MLSKDRIGIHNVTSQEVNRLLDVGRLLLAILTSEELDRLQGLLSGQVEEERYTVPLSCKSRSQISYFFQHSSW